MKKQQFNNNFPQRPHSTNIPGPRKGKVNYIVSTQSSHQRLASSTFETENDESQRNNKMNTTTFYSNNNNYNSTQDKNIKKLRESKLIDVQSNLQNNNNNKQPFQILKKYQTLNNESQITLDSVGISQMNSLHMSQGYIEPPNINNINNFLINNKDKHQLKNIYQTQQIQSKAQTNAFHTKIPHKKQNQTQLLIKYINQEGQQLSCKQIQQTQLIQQHNFYDTITINKQSNKNNNNHLSLKKNNTLNNQQRFNQENQDQDILSVENFNKNFYVKLNTSKSHHSHKNSNGSIPEFNGRSEETEIDKEIKLNSKQNDSIINDDIEQNLYQKNGSFSGKKIQNITKETLNLLIKKISQSNNKQQNNGNLTSLNSIDNNNYYNSMNNSIIQPKMRSSSTQSNQLYNRNYSIQINRSSIKNKNNSNDKKQPIINGVSIKKFYKQNKSQSQHYYNNNKNNNISNNYNDLSLSVINNDERRQSLKELTQRDYQDILNRGSTIQSARESNTSQLNEYSNNIPYNNKNQQNFLHQNLSLDENCVQYQNYKNNTTTTNNNNNNSHLQLNNNDSSEQFHSFNNNNNNNNNVNLSSNNKQYISQQKNFEKERRLSNLSQNSIQDKSNINNKGQSSQSFKFQNNIINIKNQSYSQLVEQGNHIERKMSNMSQDQQEYLETLVFGEFGTLESALIKPIQPQINNISIQINNQNQNQLNNQIKSKVDDYQSYPLSSKYKENLQRLKNRNLSSKKKQIHQNNTIIKNSHLNVTKYSETIKQKPLEVMTNYLINERSVSAREELLINENTERSQDLKEKFLKNLNLKSGQNVYGSQRNIAIRSSSQNELSQSCSQASLSQETNQNQSRIRDNNNNLQTAKDFQQEEDMTNIKQNNEQDETNNKLNDDKSNNQQEQEQDQINFENIDEYKMQQRQFSNDYSLLLKEYENSLYDRPLNIQNKNYQITPISFTYISKNKMKDQQQKMFSQMRNNLNLQNNSTISQEDSSECYSALKQVLNYNNNDKNNNFNKTERLVKQRYYSEKRCSSSQSNDINKLNLNQNISNQQDQSQLNKNIESNTIPLNNNNNNNNIKELQNTQKKLELNGMFKPYQSEDQNGLIIDNSSQPQRIIHSNFPQKINSKFLKQTNKSNSQVYTSLLSKMSAQSSLNNSLVVSQQNNRSLNTSQNGFNNNNNNNASLLNSTLQNPNNQPVFSNLLNSSNHNLNINDQQNNLNESFQMYQKIYSQRPHSISYNKRKQKPISPKMKIHEAEDSLQPWNDYTYVKYF